MNGSMRRRALSIALVAGLVVSVVFVLSAQGVYAGTKSKTLHLVKQIDDGTNKTKITYYDNGLMKKYSDGYEVRLFKYDSKGRMTESKIYKEKVKKANLRFKIKFVYSKKGKPEKIVRVVYKKGKVVSKDKLGLTVGKKNRIRTVEYIFSNYAEAAINYHWIYDSKGRVKTMVDKLFDPGDEEQRFMAAKYVTGWASAGYVKKVKVAYMTSDDSHYDDYEVVKYKTKIKSGRVAKVVKKSEGSEVDTWEFRYTKKKIKNKYIKAVKKQQKELQCCSSVSLSPIFYLGVKEDYDFEP